MVWLEIALPIAAFLLGGVPFGLLLAKAKGVDLRQVGSGNIGATNVARILGMRWGLLTLLLDALKGLLAALAARLLLDASAPHRELVIAATMLAVVLGHMFTPYLLLRGGKGVATTLGVLLAVSPWAGLVAGVLYVGLYALLRISSVGSMALTVSGPLLMILLGAPREQLVAIGVIALLIVIKHIPNLRRLVHGEEGKVG